MLFTTRKHERDTENNVYYCFKRFGDSSKEPDSTQHSLRAYLINILKALVLGRYFDKKKQDVNWFGGGNCEPSEKCFDKFKSALNETEKGHTSRDFDDHIVVICKVNKNITFPANI